MLGNILLALTLVVAVLDWIAVYKQWKTVEFICKPATMVFMFAWLFVMAGLNGPSLWFGVGVLLSLAGDVFLMLSDRWFIAGLAAFLLAHVAYIIGLSAGLMNVSLLWAGILAVILVLGAVRILRRIAAGLVAKSLKKLVVPVQVYGLVITVMLFLAMLTLSRPDWKAIPAVLVSLGAFLFYLSDIILAWNRFVSPIRSGRVMNMIAYHLGQIALIAGAIYQFIQ